jgi:glycosyltransferase involved in cell wall biosynthesis
VGVQFLYALKASDFVFQTDYAMESFKKRSQIGRQRLHVIPNAFDLSLREYFKEVSVTCKDTSLSELIVFCPGAAYLHKGFQYIPSIVKEIKDRTDRPFKFVLTLSFESNLWKSIEMQIKELNLQNEIVNFGPYKYTDLKNLLETSDIVFVPSMLETFSASYLEAMCANKKLVVAKKNFARDICGNYAIYVNPKDAIGCSKALVNLFTNSVLSQNEKSLADEILQKYGSQEERFQKIINLLKNFSTKKI